MGKLYLFIFFLILFITDYSFCQKKSLDNFENILNWKVITSDGVTLNTSSSAGYSGNSIRLNFKFNTGAGYCGIRKDIQIELPENYEFSFYIRGEMPVNNLEFKLVDSTGDNVWWVNNRNYEFPSEWKKITIKKRHINFAWGPVGGGDIKKMYHLEIFIAAGSGGKGFFEISDLNFEPLQREEDSRFSANTIVSENLSGKTISLSNDHLNSEWVSGGNKNQWISFDFGRKREFGALIIDWDPLKFAKKYDIFLSDDSLQWEKIYSVNNANGKKSYIYLPETGTRYLKLVLSEPESDNYIIKDFYVKDIGFSGTVNDFFINIAKDFPRGYFPRYLNREQSYWTISGVNGDVKETLLNEDGMFESDKSSFSIEPFIYSGNELISWNSVERKCFLENDYLPMPGVIWKHNKINLTTWVFTAGEKGKSSIYAIYELENKSNNQVSGSLFLTIRPFQVNPVSQWLNTTGGFAKINSIKRNDNDIIINDNKKIIPITKPDGTGFTNQDEGDIITFLEKNALPMNQSVNNKNGFCSGALEYKYDLIPGQKKVVYISIPFYDKKDIKPENQNETEYVYSLFKQTKDFWQGMLDKVEIILPEKFNKISNTIKSYLGYILINKDENAIQPGSRSYERAWIRDGALTSSALLRMGIRKEVKEYLDWYSNNLFKNGKIPCVVDKRGPDPVPEYDSQGEYIFAILQYYRFTNDIKFLKEKYDFIKKDVEYIDYLTSLRKTDKYKNDEKYKVFYGLVPESISHEGYSAKPMHSYWDDFFIMKGLKDAVTIAEILNKKEDIKKFRKLRDEFKENLYASIKRAINEKKIDYIPGCADMGDFDATSTAIALFPCGELSNLPQKELKNTFDKYFDYFTKRAKNEIEWDNYTPYEVRTIGAMNLMDRKADAHKMLDYFFKDQRPKEWNNWAEVVWKDPKTPKFIGDMPHTWVGSDYINSIRNMFIYEREDDNSLIIGMGIIPEWIKEVNGITIRNFPTYYGNISYTMKGNENEVKVSVSSEIKKYNGKIIIKSPYDKEIKEVFIDNKKSKNFTKNEVFLKRIYGDITIKY
jgi:hypothetical protein